MSVGYIYSANTY